MSDDNCEKSTEREFDDYFRKEEPADLIPRLENVMERLDGHDEQELEVATEIVQYVANQLEAMDEDTAGDSTTLDQGPCEESAAASETAPNTDGDNSDESPNTVGGLEPAAVVRMPETLMGEYKPYLAEAHLTQYGLKNVEEGEPLVRLSDVIEYINEFKDREELPGWVKRLFCELMNELHEVGDFTQNMEEDT